VKKGWKKECEENNEKLTTQKIREKLTVRKG
jgi:hypothetical protein